MLRVLRRQFCQFFGTSDHLFKRGVIKLVDGCRAGLLAIAGLYGEGYVADLTGGRDRISCVADIAGIGSIHIAFAFISLG